MDINTLYYPPEEPFLKEVLDSVDDTLAGMDTGREDYRVHNKRILKTLDQYPGINNEHVRLGVALHDVIPHGVLDNPDQAEPVREMVNNLFEQEGVDKVALTAAIGVAISANRWEAAAEKWRRSVDRSIDLYNDPSALASEKREIMGIPHEKIVEVARKYKIDESGVVDQLRAALTKYEGVAVNPDILRELEPKVIALDSFLETARDLDIEGLIIKTAEVMDNIRHPKEGAKASQWRDYIEMISFYAPALELFGFESLAAEARGVALEYKYSGKEYSETTDLAQGLVDKAENQKEWLDDTIGGLVEKLADEFKWLKPGDIRVSTRVKSLGSTIQKLNSEKYKRAIELPDMLGVRLILSDRLLDKLQSGDAGNSQNLETVIVGLRNSIYRGLFSLDEVEANRPNKEDAVDDSIIETRDSGYKAIHMTFVREPDGDSRTPFEVQLTTKGYHQNNTYGGPSHYLYKMLRGVKPTEQQLAVLAEIGERSKYLVRHPDHPGLSMSAWQDLLRYFPDLPTPIHELYGLVPVAVNTEEDSDDVIDITDGSNDTAHDSEEPREGVVVLSKELLASSSGVELPPRGWLPPYKASPEQFGEAIDYLIPDLSDKDKVKIANTLDFVIKNHEGQNRRSDSSITMAEGHIIPAAMFMMTQLHSMGWLHNPDKREDVVTLLQTTLLHDVVEDTTASNEDIYNQFGEKVSELVGLLTMEDKPEGETPDQKEARLAVYFDNLAGNPLAMMVKFADRMQNVTTNLVEATSIIDLTDENGQSRIAKISGYWDRTLRQLVSRMLLPGNMTNFQWNTVSTIGQFMRQIEGSVVLPSSSEESSSKSRSV